MNTPSQHIMCTANCFLTAHSKNLLIYTVHIPLYWLLICTPSIQTASCSGNTHPYIAVSRKLGTQCLKTGTKLWLIFLMELAYCYSVLLEVAVAGTFFFSFCQSCISEATRISPVNRRLIAFQVQVPLVRS